MADDTVTIRYTPTREEREVSAEAAPFFLNQEGWVQLKNDGSVNPNPATPVNNSDKK